MGRVDLIAEAEKRLEQLEWLVKRIDEAQFEQARTEQEQGLSERNNELELEIETLCEAFYSAALPSRQHKTLRSMTPTHAPI